MIILRTGSSWLMTNMKQVDFLRTTRAMILEFTDDAFDEMGKGRPNKTEKMVKQQH